MVFALGASPSPLLVQQYRRLSRQSQRREGGRGGQHRACGRRAVFAAVARSGLGGQQKSLNSDFNCIAFRAATVVYRASSA